jgi:hypothetical protein
LFISWGGITAAVIALLIAFGFLIRTHFIHKSRSDTKKKEEAKFTREWNEESVMKECRLNIKSTLEVVRDVHPAVIVAFTKEDRKKLKKAYKKIQELNAYTKGLKKDIYITLKKLEEDSIETGHHYVQVLDYLREISHFLSLVGEPLFERVENNHATTIPEQTKELTELSVGMKDLFGKILNIIETNNFESVPSVIAMNNNLINKIESIKVLQIKLIKSEKIGTRNSMVIFNLLTETKNVLLHSINVLKSHRDFTLEMA